MKGWCFIMVVFLLASCTDEDVIKMKAKDTGIFAHYDIRAEEGTEMATCVVRFYTDKTRKNTLTLDEPSKVEIDGQEIPVDSSRFLGTYYEIQKPVTEFEGPHTITFTNDNHKEYEEELSFKSLSLLTALDQPISRTDLVLELEGVQPEDIVRVVMIDTAFYSDGINTLETVKDGQLVIEKSQLQTLKNGPVVLEISKESEKSLASGVQGMLTTTYSLRRELILID